MDAKEQALYISAIPKLDINQRMELLSKQLDDRSLFTLSRSFLHELIPGPIPSLINNHLFLVRFDSVRRWLEKNTDSGVLFYGDAGYPVLLREISDPPFQLFHRGDLLQSARISVSVVGTRKSTAVAQKATFAFALEAALAECTVVSGFAMGIDQSAHRGAIAGKGITHAVLGCGLDYLQPRNPELEKRILEEGGAFISEFDPSDPPVPWRFPVRNRIISGMSPALVVVEAPLRSGALLTADHALRQGREVLVHDRGLLGAVGEGTRALHDDGAALISSYNEMSRIADARYPNGKNVILADVSQFNHGQRLMEERLGRLVRFQNTWYRLL
jgi:DNA protecting protein DprA